MPVSEGLPQQLPSARLQPKCRTSWCGATAAVRSRKSARSDRPMASSIGDSTLDEESFVQLLGSLINEAKFLQNNPPELVPVEDRGEYTVFPVCV